MPRAISLVQREDIVRRHQAGETVQAIATALQLSRWTVRHVWRRYRRLGPAGLPACRPGRVRGSRFARRIKRGTVFLKRLHPRWGAGLIRVLVGLRWPQEQLPTVRSLQRWFRQAGLPGRTRRTPPAPRVWSSRAHGCWQMDAKERIRLADGRQVSWVGVTDEYSGAWLGATVFPPGLLRRAAARGRSGGPSELVWLLGLAG